MNCIFGMNMNITVGLFFSVLITMASQCQGEDVLTRREWKVDGITREALMYVPASTNSIPVLFAFHGHGGNMNQAVRSYGYHTIWPEAIVVYPQGLNTPGRLTDPEGKRPGWQKDIGDQADRDLKFFDVMLESLKKDYKVDTKRIYSTGHSNGGAFSYLLWAARGDVFAAFAPSAATLTPQLTSSLKPKPVLHVAGENDQLVKFQWQKLMINTVLKVNQCDGDPGKPWDKNCTIYISKVNAPVVTFIHSGTHTFPKEAPALIVKFLKEQSL
jgi:polyhydroxybutyrate depolymerase